MGLFDKKQPPPRLPPTTQGPVNACPCPNCGKPNNLNGFNEMLDQNPVMSCDHCRQPFQVVGTREIKVVYLRKPHGAVTAIKPR